MGITERRIWKLDFDRFFIAFNLLYFLIPSLDPIIRVMFGSYSPYSDDTGPLSVQLTCIDDLETRFCIPIGFYEGK